MGGEIGVPTMDCCRIRIEQTKTGWEVKIDDPEIVKANRAPKSQWRDPTQEYTFESKEKVIEFVKGAMGIIEQKTDSFSSVFDKLVSKGNKEE